MTMLPRKRRREKTGCLCCRKRKIKCDNSKPRCKRCIKSSYICEWSDQVSRSVIDYVLKKSSVSSVKFIDFSESKYMRKTIAATSNSQRAADTDKIIDHAKSDNNNGNDITSSHCLKINTNNNQRFCIGNKSNNYTGSLPIQKSRLNRNVVVMNENENNISKKQILEDALFRRYLQQLGKSHVSKCNIGNTQIISTAFEASINEMSLIDSFVNGFMLAVSTVLTHESLQFSSVVIPKVIHHPILRNVFYVCGASYLCWDRKDLQFLAEEQYIICLRALQEFVQKEGIADNEELILTTMIIFCLREKYQCENKIRKDLFLIAAFEIIKYKTKIKMSKNESIVKNDNNQCENDIFKEFDEIELKLKLDEIFDYLFRIEQDSSILEDFQNGLITFSSIPMDNGISDYCITTNLLDTLDSSILSDFQIIGDISAFEKTMFESFLYNYSVNLLTLDSSIVKYMSSPFQVYKILKPILLHSPYNFPVKWMNNPIMGASLPAFELSAKANWFLLHYPLNDSYTKLVKKLRNSAKYYTSPFLPDSVKFNQREELQRKLLESCHVGNMVAKASYILLTKTLYPDYDSSAEDIQEALDVFFENLKKLSDHSQICGMCAWPCAIAGTAINKPYQRDYLEKRINKFCRVKKSKAFWRILSFLKFTWGENSIPGPGWDALLNPSSFKDLFI